MTLVLRRAVAVALSIAVQVSAVTLPFLHAHTDDHASPHHDAHAVHSHFAEHEARHAHSSETAIDHDDDDDQAVYLQLFVAVGAQAAPVGAPALAVFELATPAEQPLHSPVLVVHGHDPPLSDSLSPRAPPSSLS
jgi:hypothetical protein